jgi:ABC-2 type transport system permease protein
VSAGKYAAVLAISLRQALTHRGAAWLRCVFFCALLLIFSRLWKVAIGPGVPGAPGAVEMLWYLALTEWVTLGAHTAHLQIERDVQTGDIAYGLPRPVSYLGLRVADALGQTFGRMALLGPVGFVAAWAMAGALPSDARGLLLAVPVCVLAAVVSVVWWTAVGVSAFWLQDASPVAWVWQKLTFILGGLILPLSIYPEPLRVFAEWTPFAAMLYGPGSLALGFDAAGALRTTLLLLLWGAVGAWTLARLFSRGLRVLDVNGG